MATYKATLSFPLDSMLPRDRVQITPHFAGDNPTALGNALKTNIQAQPGYTTGAPFTVKIYDATKAAPNPPLYETEVAGTPPITTKPREIALCLSYYSTWNRPRYRGRLFLPAHFVSGAITLRPSAQQLTDAMSWANVLITGMPPGHNWVLYSPTRHAMDGVTNYWVDDEWDVVRSRGLRGTTRQEAAVP
jgi:hypothetical protein